MTTDGQRLARAAFDAARAPFERLTRGSEGAESVDALREAWQVTEEALRTLAGTTALSGIVLVRELRQRNLLSLDEAHALVDFQAAAERANSDDYVPTPSDGRAAVAARDRLLSALAREETRPTPDATPYSGPISPASGIPSGSPPPFGEASLPAARRNWLGVGLVLLAVVAVISVGGYYALQMTRESSDLRVGRTAFAAGDRLSAKNAFSAAAGANPSLAEPHIYLGRMARDEGDLATASSELRRAVEVEPTNPLAHRELAAYLLASGQLELARTFYQRAIQLDPTDKVALGWMACTLHRMGRQDLAARFLDRAGAGGWQGCLTAIAPAFGPSPAAPAVPPR